MSEVTPRLRTFTRVIASVGVLLLIAGAGVRSAAAQTRDRVPETPAGTIARGWAAVASGRHQDAVTAALAALKLEPGNHHALGLLIAAEVAAGRPMSGLDAYERFLGTKTPEDVFLLEHIAAGVLHELSSSTDAELRSEALLILATHGGASARAALAAGKSIPVLAARARLGDTTAVSELQQLAASDAIREKAGIVKALQDAGRASAPVIASLLNDASPMTRSAAAAALGNLGDKSTVPSLQKLLADNDPSVRATAAVALAKLGDGSGNEVITAMINSDVPDVRLFAAEAYEDRPSPDWVDAIRPSLSDTNGLTRLIAASRLAKADPEAARATLLAATADANPVIRMEAAKILVRRQLAPVAVLRKLLRDADPWVRLRGAEGVMEMGRTPSPGP